MAGIVRTGPRTIVVWDGAVEYEITVGPEGSDVGELVAWLVRQGADPMPALSGFGDWLGKALNWITNNGPKIVSAVQTVKGVAGQKSAMRKACEQSGPTPACCAWARNSSPDPLYPRDVEVYCETSLPFFSTYGSGSSSTNSNTLLMLGVGTVLLLAVAR